MSAPGRPDLSHGLNAGVWARNRALVTIAEALRRHRGEVAATARELGVDRRTLTRWLKRFATLREARVRAYRAPSQVTKNVT